MRIHRKFISTQYWRQLKRSPHHRLLRRAYAYLEVHVHHSASKIIQNDRETRKIADQCLHFPPDVLARAIPEIFNSWLGSRASRRQYGFVVAPPNLTTRFMQSLTRRSRIDGTLGLDDCRPASKIGQDQDERQMAIEQKEVVPTYSRLSKEEATRR